MAKLVVDNLNKTYFGGYQGIKDVSFTLDEGEVLTIYGKTGSGKSTLCKLLTTLETPSSGSITLDGVDISTIDTKDLNISFATYELPLFVHKSVFDNLAYPLKIRKVDKDEIACRVDEIAKVFGLYDILTESVRYFDMSTRGRIMIARAFVKKSDIYIFDDILRELNVTDREENMRILPHILKSLHATVIYATNRLEEVSLIGGDNVILLSGGEMIDKGNLHDIYLSPSCIDSAKLLDPDVNILTREVKIDDKGTYIDLLGKRYIDVDDIYVGKDILLSFNIDNVNINHVGKYTITDIRYLVDKDILSIDIGDDIIRGVVLDHGYHIGDEVSVDIDDIKLYDLVAERRIIN